MASGSPSDADQLETLLSSADCAEELVVSDLGLVNWRPHRAEHDRYGVSARSVEPATPGVLQHRLVAGLTDVNAERDVTGSPLIPSLDALNPSASPARALTGTLYPGPTVQKPDSTATEPDRPTEPVCQARPGGSPRRAGQSLASLPGLRVPYPPEHPFRGIHNPKTSTLGQFGSDLLVSVAALCLAVHVTHLDVVTVFNPKDTDNLSLGGLLWRHRASSFLLVLVVSPGYVITRLAVDHDGAQSEMPFGI